MTSPSPLLHFLGAARTGNVLHAQQGRVLLAGRRLRAGIGRLRVAEIQDGLELLAVHEMLAAEQQDQMLGPGVVERFLGGSVGRPAEVDSSDFRAQRRAARNDLQP